MNNQANSSSPLCADCGAALFLNSNGHHNPACIECGGFEDRVRVAVPMSVVRRGERIDFESNLSDVEAAIILDHMPWSNFARDLSVKFETHKGLSAKQLAWAHFLAVEQIKRDAIRAAEPKPVTVTAPLGRQVVEGEILRVKVGYGHFGETIRMTVKVVTPEGEWKCNGTVPSSIRCEDLNSLEGQIVRFTATLVESDKPEFVFAKRPSKASLLASVEEAA